MKREIFLKVILGLVIVSVLFMIPVKTFAAENINDYFNSNTDESDTTGDNTDNNDDMEDLGGRDDLVEEEKKEEQKEEQEQPKQEEEKKEEQQTQQQKPTQQESLPKAGLAEDTIMIIAISAMLIIAVITYVKISEYSNI